MNPTPASIAVASRRGFLKTSTVATAGVLASGLAPALLGAEPPPLKVGLIGCGGRGRGAAAQALNADKGAILTAVGDVFAEACAGAVNELKRNTALQSRVRVDPGHMFSGLDNFQQVIASGVDVVLLCAPPGFRPAHLKAAVDAGKHIFCEKPMATDATGVRSVMASAAAAKQKGLALVAGFCWRYDTARREFYKRIHDGAIGAVRAIHATYLTSPVKPMPPASTRPAGMGDVEWQVRNWYNFVWTCGDGLVEQACHSVDKILWAMRDQPPARCVATGGRQIPNHEGNIYDHIDVFYEWENGVRATMAQRQIAQCASDNSDYLMGEKGFGTIRGTPVIRGAETWRYRGEPSDMYQNEHNELFASIRSGQPINDGVWMTQSTLAAIMGRMAAYTGQEVSWEQALNSTEKLVPDNLTWDMKLPIAPMAVPGKTKLI